MSDEREQARADAFYELFERPGSGWRELLGQSGREVVARLGPPSEVSTLVHEGHTWTQVAYLFDAVPRQASEDEREAYRRGMRFSPVLLFRDGVLVPPETFDEEVLRGEEPARIPDHLRFHQGGEFP